MITIESNIIGIYRSHPLVLLKKWFVMTVLSGIIFFLTLVVPAQNIKLRIIIGVLFFLVILSLLISSYIQWRSNIIVITEKKIVMVKLQGVFRFSLEEFYLERVKGLDIVREGIMQNVFDFGDIHVSGEIHGDEGTDTVLKNIWPVDEAFSLLKKQADFYRERAHAMD